MTYTLKHLSNSSYIIEEKQFKDIIELHEYIELNILEVMNHSNDHILINDKDITEQIKETEYYTYYYSKN